jgi:DMSO/TMAO reductase YedYZ molybdopterin-dependent catalytic subunit
MYSHFRFYAVFTLLFVMLFCTVALPQDWTLTISGAIKHPMTFTQSDFSSLPRRSVVATDPKGRSNEYQGVPLFELLLKGGAPSGDSIHGKNLTLYLQADALDGYEVVYALPEIDTLFTDKIILVADRKNGGPLDEKEAPLQIIVPGEKLHARWIRQLKALKILRSNE